MAFSISRLAIAAFAVVGVAAATPALAEPYQNETSREARALSSFTKVYIAPVAADLPEPDIGQITYSERGNRPIQADDVERKAQDLHDDLMRTFKKKFDISPTPGTGILTIQTTLTELVATRPTQADFERNPRLDFSSTFAGGAAFAVDFSENGAPISSYEKSIFTTFNDGDPRVAIWADADRVFGRFSRKLVRHIRKN